MGRIILHYEGKFAEWSTVVDAPTTPPMDEKAFEADYIKQYGTSSLREFEQRMERAKKYGSSLHDGSSFADVVSINRAGHNEAEMTLEQLQQWMKGEGS